MKKFVKFFVVAIVAVLSLSSCYERVDAGYEGVLVNLYGDKKGVDDANLCTGAVWYNPFTQRVFEYPVYVQTVDYPAFEVNSKDGTKFTIDPSILIKIEDTKSPYIYKKYRTELSDIINKTLYVYVRDAARNEFNKYNADQIISNRSAVDKSFETNVRKALKKEHFILEQLTPGIKYPQSYEDAINAKNKAVQDSMRVRNEVAVAKADAERKIVVAQAEAKANALKTQALTNAILKARWIEKWDGHLPTVTSGNNMILNLKDFE